MQHPSSTRRSLARWLTGCCLALSALASPAQTGGAPATSNVLLPSGSSFSLSGPTMQGRPFSLASLRGRVVLVYYWATDCPVCLDKMPELRANAEGWRGKPFSVVHVQMDRQPQAPQLYWQTVDTTVPGAMHTVLWHNDPAFRDSLPRRPPSLPFSVLLDRQGRVVASFEGRIPPQTWDQVADLLP